MILANVQREPVSAKDFHFALAQVALPERVDLRQYAGDLENQYVTGSCTANATVSALEMILQRAGRFEHLSRLFVYYNERKDYPHLRGKDGGAYLSDGFKSVYRYGVPNESVWGFDVSKVNEKPSPDAYAAALAMRVGKYQRVAQFLNPSMADANILRIKIALACGYAVPVSMAVSHVIFGLHGPIDAPACYYGPDAVASKARAAGGHAMNIVGYTPRGLIVENSWGDGWGDGGYFLLSYEALALDGFDAWACTAFAGIDQQPDYSFAPVKPVTATIEMDYSRDIQFKPKTSDTVMYGYLLRTTPAGGEPPYAYQWSTSDDSVILPEEEFAAPRIDLSGWHLDELRSVTVTCTVSDSQIPAQQTTVSTLIRVCNGVDINSPRGQAFRLYRAALGRTPDQEGLLYWTNEIASGMELREAAARFMDSQEFHALYRGGISDKEFVTLLYIHVLNRQPDPDGHAYWLGRIQDGYSTQDVLVSFSESPENKEKARW